MLLRLENIQKDYADGEDLIHALDGINLSFGQGEMTAIMGRSGCGKTTLINIIGMLLTPTGGEYFIDDMKINFENKKKLASIRRKEIGFIVQDFALIGRKTVWENVALPLQGNKLSKNEKEKLIQETLRSVDLYEKKNKYPNALSGGEKQRVAIARAIINKPRILLADEPTGALDWNNAERIMELLQQLSLHGTSVIVVTHDKAIADKCQRTIQISYGHVALA